ncbi:MAG: hypothetical protein WCF67_00630 [Chitinophagaceae bacterium]
MKTKKPVKNIAYCLLAYDKKKDQVSVSSPYINGKWMENNEKGFHNEDRMNEKPLISFKDIDGDCKNEVIVQERAHNGNIYNAVIYHYFVLGKDMNLQKMLALEAKQRLSDVDCFMFRVFTNNTILSTIHCKDSFSQVVGKAHINLKADSVITKIEIFKKEYSEMIITGSGISQNAFLKKGYKFQY